MSAPFTNLLQRQLRKHFGDLDQVPAELLPFLQSVNDSYVHYENDRKLMDRANEISSQELIENNRTLSRKNEMLDAFVYRVTHDLKTPVNNLLSLASMLSELERDTMAANPLVSRTVTSISETAERMNTRINDLLDLSRMERAIDAAHEQVDLNEVAEQALADLQVEIEKSGAEINCDFSAVPKVTFGKENLTSLLANLLSNAIKYRSPDRKPEVWVRSYEQDGHTILSVSDNGMGIDLDRHGAKLFGMFNRFHNHVAGTGVGLFIIKKIIEKAGGKIHVDSAVGSGTTFYINFSNAKSSEETQLHPTR